MNTLELGADMMEHLTDCHVGDEKTLSVPVKVTKYGKNGAVFEITGPPMIEEEPEETEAATEETSMPMSESPPAVERMLAKRNRYA